MVGSDEDEDDKEGRGGQTHTTDYGTCVRAIVTANLTQLTRENLETPECFSLVPSIHNDLPPLIQRPGLPLHHHHHHPRQRGILPQKTLHQRTPRFSVRLHSQIMKFGQTQLYEIQIIMAVCLPSSPASQNID